MISRLKQPRRQRLAAKFSAKRLFLESLETRWVMDGASEIEPLPVELLFHTLDYQCGAVEVDDNAVVEKTSQESTDDGSSDSNDTTITVKPPAETDGTIEFDLLEKGDFDKGDVVEGFEPDFVPCMAFRTLTSDGNIDGEMIPEDVLMYTTSGGAMLGIERFDSAESLQERLLSPILSAWENQFGTEFTNYSWPTVPYYEGGEYPLVLRTAALDQSVGQWTWPESLASSALDYQSTNLQVAGIDEADIAKTDGSYIYTVYGDRLVITDIRDPADLSVSARLTLDRPAASFYVNGDRLTVLSVDYSAMDVPQVADLMYRSWMPILSSPSVHVTIYDISDRSHPTEVEDVVIDGTLVDSRVIDDTLVLITQDSVSIPQPTATCGETTDLPANDPFLAYGRGAPQIQVCTYETREAYLARVTPDLLGSALPQYKLATSGTDPALLTSVDQIAAVGLGESQLVSTTLIDLGAEHPAVGASAGALVPWGSQVHVSENSVYLTTNHWGLEGETTAIVQFSLSETAVSVAAVGEVPGHLVSPFSMNEYAGSLRVATTSGWGASATNGVYVLQTQGERLEIVGSVRDITPGESLQSARFLGDQAYLVTFLRIDPLVVVDLSDPTNPTVTGQLDVPGFSSYLHPFGDYLLGLGQDADPNTGWTTNPQVSLFDTSDPENPLLVDRVSIAPNSHSWSTGFSDYHAVNFFAEQGLFAVPILLNELTAMPVDLPITFPGDLPVDLPLLRPFDFVTTNLEWVDRDQIEATGTAVLEWVDQVTPELPRLARLAARIGMFGPGLNLGGKDLLEQVARLLPDSVRDQLPEELPSVDELKELLGAMPDEVLEKLRSLRDSLPANLRDLAADLFSLLDQPAEDLLRPRTGLWLFQVDPTAGDALRLSEVISHDLPVDRSFLVGEVLFTVSADSIQAHSVSDLSVKLDEVFIGRRVNDDYVTVDIEGGPQTIEVLGNDHLPEGAKIVAVSTPEKGGEAVIAEDGRSVLFTPSEDAEVGQPFMIAIWPPVVNNNDSFQYTVELASGDVETALVTVNFEFLSAGKRMAELAIADLASREGVDAAAIQVLVTYFQQWGDSCLGIPNPDEACAAVITPGFVVQLSLDGRVYEYHTDTHTTVKWLPATSPVAVAPDYFTVTQDSSRNTLDVLANDFSNVRFFRAPEISAVTAPSSGGQVSISADGFNLLYTPATGFVGIETFRYTVDNGESAEVTVSVVADPNDPGVQDPLVAIRLELTDADGNVVSDIGPGDSFFLNVYTDDLRTDGEGVYASYFDVTFDAAVAKVDGALEFPGLYINGQSGVVIAGGLDELGAFSDSLAPLGGEERLVVRVPMRAVGDGILSIGSNPADLSPQHDTTLYGRNTPVPKRQIGYGSVEVVVGNIFHNARLAADVDGDAVVAPIDALAIINFLNNGGSMGQLRQARSMLAGSESLTSSVSLMDTNGDGEISPQDVLIVINRINSQLNSAAPVTDPVTDSTAVGESSPTGATQAALPLMVPSAASSFFGPVAPQEYNVARLARRIAQSAQDYAAGVDALFAEL